MAPMAKKESLSKKTDQELMKLLEETRASFRSERFAAAGARAKDPNAARQMRKTIARVLTEQSARSASAASDSSPTAA